MADYRSRITGLRRVKASDLEPHPENWREHLANQVGAIEGVLDQVGFAGAVLARELPDGRLQIIDGHARAETMGDQEVPVLVTDLDEDEARLVLATYDPIGAMAGHDGSRLAALLDSLPPVDSEDLDALLTDLRLNANGALPEPQGDPDAVPETPKTPSSRLGEVHELGPHRVMCGDSGNDSAVQTLLADTPISTVVYDPDWDAECEPSIAVREGASILAFSDGMRISDVLRLFGAPAWLFVWDCISSWYVPNQPLRRMKLCAWFGDLDTFDADGAHWGTAGEGLCRYEVDSVLRPKRKSSRGRGTYYYQPDPRGKHLADVFSRPLTAEHMSGPSHAKPVDWVRLLIGCCGSGDVYDPFLGSGTTLIAAEQLGRICYGMEIEPRYVDVIRQRYADFVDDQRWAP